MMLILAAAAAVATMQMQFDEASAAVEAGRCADAVAGFDAIVAHGVRSSAVGGMIALRKGRCLAQLGRADDADAALTSGLAAVGEVPAYVTDRALGLVARGRIAYLRFDYPAAARDFAAARDMLPVADRFEPLLWLTRATMFDAGDAARGYADEALALAATLKANPAAAARVHTLHARVLINHGNVREGYAELRKALDEQGGLTDRVNADSISTRSDLAIAALLSHDDEAARKFLAYTGAGHGTPFGSAADMEPPPCDGVDLKPDDSAVVEFGIGSDGAVTYATPVYASRLGPSAAVFAQAVSSWSWKSDALAKIAPLFRAITRVELRCSTASRPPPVVGVLHREVGDWLKAHGVPPFFGDDSAAAKLVTARAELRRRRTNGSDDAALIPVLWAIGDDPVAPPEERRATLIEAQSIAGRVGAPATIITALAVSGAKAEADDEHRGSSATRANAERAALRSLLASPAVTADARSRDVVRLLVAEPSYFAPAPADAGILLRAVADDAALPEHDLLRSAAQVRLSSLYALSGDLTAARASFAASGVTAQQCALVDAQPAATHLGVAERDFPKDALRWGFEGWVRLEFDVAADGNIANQRAVIAYPPFIFGPAAVASSRGWRYQQSFRPDGIAGCSGAHQQIKFRIG